MLLSLKTGNLFLDLQGRAGNLVKELQYRKSIPDPVGGSHQKLIPKLRDAGN